MPGFRFHPTDEELVAYYLPRQLRRKRLPVAVITQLDIYKYDPWDLPKLATVGEKEWFFFCPRDRKYRNSLRPNRVTDSGFWKATGTDRPIYSTEGAKCIGLKKSLVFYKGRAAKGVKTDWMMHEFRLPASTTDAAHTLTQNDGWAVCRIFKKTKMSQKHKQIGTGTSHELASGTVDQPQESLGVQSQYLSVESKDQDSDSVGDDPEASDDMISDFNSEDQARMRNSSRSDVLHHLGSFFPLNLPSIFSPQNFRFLHNSYKTHNLQELIIRSMLNLCSEVSFPNFMIS
ncbi:unnamed protein product [Sphagnum compactum]